MTRFISFPGISSFGSQLSSPELPEAGHGVCVLLHPKHAGSATLWQSQSDTQALWVRLKASLFGLDRDVFIAAVYIPPATSPQLRSKSLAPRMQCLRESALLAQQHGYVVLGGDFNAKVSNLPDVLVSEQQQFIFDSGLCCERGSSHAGVNLHGQLLLDLCSSTTLVLGTGRLPGDTSALAASRTHASGSRLDHFLMDCDTLARAVDSHVVPCRHDSDHRPLVLSLVSAPPAEAAAAPPVSDRPGQPLPRLLWDGAKQEEYAEQLRSSLPSLDDCHRLVKGGQVEEAFHKLGSVLQQAAVSAGCGHRPTSKPRKGPFRDKPYFDDECRQLRAKFRWAARHDPSSVRILARRFSYTIRRKCRQYRQRQTPLLLRHLRSNHKCFWTKFNSKQGGLPDALSSHSAWQQFHQQLCAPPAQGRQPPASGVPLSTPNTDGLDALISQVEVEKPFLSCLMARHQGRQAGLLSCCGIQPIIWRMSMATRRRSGFWHRSLLIS